MQWLCHLWLTIALVRVTTITGQDDDTLIWDAVEQIVEREIEDEQRYDNVKKARAFLEEFDRGCRYYGHLVGTYGFKYETNVTTENANTLSEKSLKNSNWAEGMLKQARMFDTSDFDREMKRMFKFLRRSTAPKDERTRAKLEKLENKLTETYSSARVCNETKCYAGETDLVSLFANTSTDYHTLLWAWRGWHDATGPKMKKTYTQMVEAMNTGARDNGYNDMSLPWMLYEMDDPQLNTTAFKIWDQVQPFYEELHAYVRYNLEKRYPGKVHQDEPIPEHLLGNVWGQEWGHIYPLMEPYPEVKLTDVTEKMRQQNYTVHKIFKTAESFFTSLGLPEMTQTFWTKSLFEDPKDGRVVQCHASAADLMDKERQDFRIKMCTQVSQYNFMTAHHEMGHIEYYMLYSHQPCLFRTGANAAFHEAVGDTVQLSASTPQYLYKIGLASYDDIDGGKEKQYKRGINFLLSVALNKVAFLPYGLMIDAWRWSVFNGTTTPRDYNHNWWKLRVNLGGVAPPIDRSMNDFDPGSKYHISSNTRYIRYFFSFLLQFQFHRSLCDIKGHEGPYHTCNIHGSKTAGGALREMLRLGESRPWQDALEILTGQREVDPSAMLQYFAPLHKWLKETNRKNGVKPGWKTENFGIKW